MSLAIPFTFYILFRKEIISVAAKKKRSNLVRAIYKDSDIYLFDDPLSALDIKVKKEIMGKCFCTLWAY